MWFFSGVAAAAAVSGAGAHLADLGLRARSLKTTLQTCDVELVSLSARVKKSCEMMFYSCPFFILYI